MTSPTYGDVTQLTAEGLEFALEKTRDRLAEPDGLGRVAMRNLDVACDDWTVLLTERKRRVAGGKPFLPHTPDPWLESAGKAVEEDDDA